MLGLSAVLVLTLLVSPIRPQCFSENDAALKVSHKARQELLQGQLQFSTDLMQALNELKSSDNLFFSPSSVYNALLLAYFISANETEESLKAVLHIPESQDKLGTLGAYSLDKYNQTMRTIKNSLQYQLKNANRIYVSNKFKVRPCLLKHLEKEIEKVDFSKNLTATVEGINTWVMDQTRNNIKDLLSPDSLTPDTNLVLVNAAYFRGFWVSKFSTSETKESTFTLANGTEVPVMMMNLETNFRHYVDQDLEADVLELPYQGDDISMFILLPLNPSADAVSSLVNKSDAETILNVVHTVVNTSDDVLPVAIPKFSVDKELSLTQVLESMNVGDLFEDTADFSTLTNDPGLRLDAAIHKAKITVDENGTEAAAATAIFSNRFGGNSYIANHPFVYFIFDKKMDVILFFGVFNSPET